MSLFTGFVACEDEQELRFLEAKGDFAILSPTSGDAVVLGPETPLNPGLSLTWAAMDYGTPTSITYVVQIDKAGDNFDSPLDLVSTSNTYASVISEALNGASVSVGLTPFTQGAIEIRVKSSVGEPASQERFSDVITYLVTPYSTSLPKLAVPGNHQGWNPPTAPQLAASAFGETDYEGFVYLDGGFKFVGADQAGNFNWGTNEYGDDGSFSGVLVAVGQNCTASAGYYRVRANTTTLVYTVEPTAWGIVGSATPGGWDASTALTYNPTTKKWEGDVQMTAGAYKFRANNAWTINLGGDSDDDGSMNYDGPDITLADSGNYRVVLDLSNPRQYTYTLTLN
ncbi:SusE domain-containing protein [Flavobacterium sp.]|uniref:SusE domain-containing protein n=1 Tax=Flavobacterium sp. TaxID=239 RepID=UPI002608EAAA|nr:SusE domain-containing protein [Flavobacterium sp.]